MDTWLEVDALEKRYRVGSREIPVLAGVSFHVRRGEALAIVGASGAGKSTLLNILGGLDRPTAGRVRLDGRDLYQMTPAARARIRARKIGFVFQAFHLLPELDLVENVMLPALASPGAFRHVRRHRERARALLERVGLDHRIEHRPDELSGGEQQRAALARALMNEPELVLADEPTGNLDSANGSLVLDCLFDLVREGRRTLLLVTHNETLSGRCGRRLLLQDGELV